MRTAAQTPILQTPARRASPQEQAPPRNRSSTEIFLPSKRYSIPVSVNPHIAELPRPLEDWLNPPQLSPGLLTEHCTVKSVVRPLLLNPLAAPIAVATPRDKGTGARIRSVSSGPAGARAAPACVSPLVGLLLKSRSVETLTVFRRYSVAAGDFA